MNDVDILVSGAGIAGLIAAAAFNHAGFTVQVVDPIDPFAKQAEGKVDRRSTAYLQPARHLLEEIGLWDLFAPHTTPLDALRIIDTKSWPPEITETRTFSPIELGEESFGWNIPNAIARDVLLDHLAKQPGITLRLGTGFKSMLTRTTEARIRLSDGSTTRARLVVGADGRDSPVRDAVGIDVQTTRYGQKALAFHATHAIPHDHVSTEIYNQGGAFTTVPLPDHNGQPCSAIVWMNDGAQAKSLADLPASEFDQQMTTRACAILGPMTRITPLNTWPVISQRATKLWAERTLLIAEAAHVLPPIGAQGLNTSIEDIKTLYNLLKTAPNPLGSFAHFAQYDQKRAKTIARRMNAIDLFNRICQSNQPAIQTLRSLGLRAAHDIKPLRSSLMRAGLGKP